MSYFSFNIETYDGLELYGQAYIPLKKSKAVIYLVHGLGDHSGRFSHVAMKMESTGFAFISFDLRGHGKSEGKRGHAPSFDSLFDDISLVLKKHRAMFPGIPQFLYGHSFGGNLVLNYILKKEQDFAGAIVTSPWLKLAFEPPKYKIKLAEFADKFIPSITMKTGLDPKAISRDADVFYSYIHDPLVHDKISARMFIETRKSGLFALGNANRFPVPILLMHGSKDRITSFNASQKFAQICGTNCEFKEWDGCFHELHNEPEKTDVIAYMIGWLLTKIQ